MNNNNSKKFHQWLQVKKRPSTEDIGVFNKISTDAILKALIEKEDYCVDNRIVYGFAKATSWQPYRKVALEWLDSHLSNCQLLQALISKWKTTIQAEITLLRNLLNHDM